MIRPPLLLAFTALAFLSATGAEAGGRRAPPPTTFYGTAPLTAADRNHILNGTFTIVKIVREMPTPVQKLLIPDTKDPLNGMADAGQDFERTDVVMGKPLPFRRLVLAAVNAQYCLVYFEQGGIGYSERVMLFHLQNGRAAMRWSAYLPSEKALRTFPALCAAIKSGRYHVSAASSYPASLSRRNAS